MAKHRLARLRASKPARPAVRVAARKVRPRVRKVARVAVSAAKRAKVRRRTA